MRLQILKLALAALCVGCILGCVATRPLRLRSSALQYLYPEGKAEATPPQDVTLKIPARVGLAFAPSLIGSNDPFTELQKQHLLSRISGAFNEKKFIASIDPLPSTYLTEEGSFQELDRLATAFGLDLIALVSYDQKQFTESTGASWTYLTIVGAFAVKGEKNETRTVMDTAVFDIPSHALLFRTAGESSVQARSTPIAIDRALRLNSEESFELATDDLIENLETALQEFQKQVKTGTVRGEGTPAVKVILASGAAGSGSSGGAGALGVADLLIAAALVGLYRARRCAARS